MAKQHFSIDIPSKQCYDKGMKTIKQPDTWSCCICCIQMITFRPRKEVLKVVNRSDKKDYKEGVHVTRFIPYLYNRGIDIGVYCGFDPPLSRIKNHSLSVEIDMGKPALLIVKSKTKHDANHIVLWDGENLRDPSNTEGETSDLNDYKLVQWIPVHFTTHKKKERFYNHYHGKHNRN